MSSLVYRLSGDQHDLDLGISGDRYEMYLIRSGAMRGTWG